MVPNWIRRQELTSSEPRWVTEYGRSAEEPSIDESRLIEEYTSPEDPFINEEKTAYFDQGQILLLSFRSLMNDKDHNVIYTRF